LIFDLTKTSFKKRLTRPLFFCSDNVADIFGGFLKTFFHLLIFLICACSSPEKVRREAVREGVKQELPKIRKCYNDEVRKHSGLEGKVLATFQVDSLGKAKDCKTRAEMDSTVVEKCICDAILAAQFPAAPEGSFMEIQYPFEFTDSNKDIPEEYRKLSNH
jgi:hypothetical protein